MIHGSHRFVTIPLCLALLGVWTGCSQETKDDEDTDSSRGGEGPQDMASGGASGSGGAPPAISLGDPWESQKAGVFVHLFEWPWPDIAMECEQVLGPFGYSAVQVSPPNEHWARTQSPPWWQRYQPISYQLESRSGSREEFIDMVNRCAAVGVEIYVDAVINHMSAQPNGTGSAGTKFSKYSYPGVWTVDDFRTPPCSIESTDYVQDGRRVQECELLGLSDLNTGLENVRAGLADYLKELIALGVQGFRIDAAKHMAAADIQAILELVARDSEVTPFVFLEVIQGAGEAITSADYLPVKIGTDQHVSLTDFGYASFADQFRLPSTIGGLSNLNAESWELPPDDRTVVFTDNHDTQRNGSISYRDGKSHELANIFLLAHPHGYPKVMSSYSFTEGTGRDAGPPSNAEFATRGPHHQEGSPCVIDEAAAPFDANTLSTLADGRWVCEHRNPALRAMLRFRRQTAGAALVHQWGSGAMVAFGRDGQGFVVINQENDVFIQSLQTGLPAGEYCNILVPEDSCEGEASVVVDESGTAQFTLPAQSAWAGLVP